MCIKNIQLIVLIFILHHMKGEISLLIFHNNNGIKFACILFNLPKIQIRMVLLK